MGFSLESPGVYPPQWPHIVCAGDTNLSGRGWAWHDTEARQRCYTSGKGAGVAASAVVVAAAIDGHDLPGIDKMLAIATLEEELPRGLKRVFRVPCPACEGDHYKRAERIILALKHVHPAAVPALRKARVPERIMREPLVRDVGDKLPTDPEELKALLADPYQAKKVKSLLRRAENLPVWRNDAERTRLAQIAFARQYSLGVRSR